MSLAVGDTLPDAVLYENNPNTEVNIKDLGRGKKIIIFGVPGAFTPGCSKSHLPSYLEASSKLKEKGIQEVVCVSVNDPFVMAAWGEHNSTDGKVRMLADTFGNFTKGIGMELDLSKVLGSVRSKRYSLLAEDNVVKILNVEPDGTGLTCSLAKSIVDMV